MPSEQEITAKFWKALKSDRTVMLGLADDHGDSQPMSVQLEDDEGGPLWIFTSKRTDLAKALGSGQGAVVQFASKGHDLFAALHGRLCAHEDRETIDRLWNPFVAAWFEGGKEDPDLLLMRFDADNARIWLNENSLTASVKMLLGRDPKQEYKDKVADVPLN